MSNVSTTPGPQRRRQIAFALGSTDGTRKGIESTFDQRRFDARVAFETIMAEIDLELQCYERGSKDGTPNGIKAERRDAFVKAWANGAARLEDEARIANRYPALATAKRKEILSPFGVNADDDN